MFVVVHDINNRRVFEVSTTSDGYACINILLNDLSENYFVSVSPDEKRKSHFLGTYEFKTIYFSKSIQVPYQEIEPFLSVKRPLNPTSSPKQENIDKPRFPNTNTQDLIKERDLLKERLEVATRAYKEERSMSALEKSLLRTKILSLEERLRIIEEQLALSKCETAFYKIKAEYDFDEKFWWEPRSSKRDKRKQERFLADVSYVYLDLGMDNNDIKNWILHASIYYIVNNGEGKERVFYLKKNDNGESFSVNLEGNCNIRLPIDDDYSKAVDAGSVLALGIKLYCTSDACDVPIYLVDCIRRVDIKGTFKLRNEPECRSLIFQNSQLQELDPYGTQR